MKLLKVGAIPALLIASSALIGCSSEHDQQAGEKASRVSFNLNVPPGVVIPTVEYDLNTNPAAPALPADVIDGSIPVPDSDSSVSLGIGALAAGDYSLLFTAHGTYNGGDVTCTSTPATTFHLNAKQDLALGNVTLTCSVTSQDDQTGSVTADVNVVVSTITVGGVVQTFSWGPRTVKGHKEGTACVYAPVALKVATPDPTVTYAWSTASDGTFAMNATNTAGEYHCASTGPKTLTVMGTKGAQSSSKTFTVSCDGAPCDFVCGNGTKEGSEQCDDGLPHCTSTCTISPVCNDGITDSGECEPPNTPTCSATCTPLGASCGNGILGDTAGEECDNGALNSNTVANACRTNCKLAKCGDGVIDSADQCDNGAANSNTAPNACRTNCTLPTCGDGVVDPSIGDQCDPPAAGICNASCQTISAPPARHVACLSCIHASADGDFQTTSCDPNVLCTAAQNCAIDKDCFSPLSAFCWCGTSDIELCTGASYPFPPPVTAGADPYPVSCVPELTAGLGNPTSNGNAIDRMFESAQPAGPGMLILNDIPFNLPECTDQCL